MRSEVVKALVRAVLWAYASLIRDENCAGNEMIDVRVVEWAGGRPGSKSARILPVEMQSLCLFLEAYPWVRVAMWRYVIEAGIYFCPQLSPLQLCDG